MISLPQDGLVVGSLCGQIIELGEWLDSGMKNNNQNPALSVLIIRLFSSYV
ncbi:MAG: hypothetical protein ACHQET_14025 [Chitinophagales bacterium]